MAFIFSDQFKFARKRKGELVLFVGPMVTASIGDVKGTTTGIATPVVLLSLWHLPVFFFRMCRL